MEEFSPDYALNHWDKPIKRVFKDEAKDLLYELINNRLHVVLVPAPEPKHYMHMIRAVESENPDWYRELYNQISGFRRDNSVDSLKRLAKAQDYPAGIFPFAAYDIL